ncbi:lipopolysaccharide biosynthesis protein [Phenylobacterium sp.]|uniref:polysaccharide biosynthesis protein HfsF n=1 Tax=Phenylobacterium sp. TaxID=1871053 RepID=UPI002734C391|nr:lipopolysaccharide biosynthesis protein [Phenylobacterium sp.]MDP3660266.1 lipopolysaccharide biosynthesis protein [Phenylobacterium sp.]
MFWRGVIGYLPVNVVQGVVGLLTIVTFTRLLTPEQYGHYALGFSVMVLVHTSLLTWTEAAMARFWVGEEARGDASQHMATLYRTWLVLLAALPPAALVIAFWPMQHDLKLAAAAGLAAVAPRSIANLIQQRQRAAGEVRNAAFMDIAQTLGAFGIGVAMALAGWGGAAPVLGAAAAAGLCAMVLLPRELGRAKGGRFEPKRARSYAAYGTPVALSLILALVLATTDRFVIAAYLDEASVGVYHAGYSLANRTLDVLFIWLGGAGAPALIMAMERGGRPALASAAREQASLMILLTLPAAAGVALTAGPLSDLLVGPALREGAAQVTPWIAASGFLGGMTTYYFSQAFTLARRTGRLLAAMAIPAVANLALNLVLIPHMGLTGALLATLISFGLGLIATLALGRGLVDLPIPWKTLAEAGLATLLMGLAVNEVPSLGGVIELALKAGVGALVYGVVVYVLDAGGLRSRAGQLLRTVRARPAA